MLSFETYEKFNKNESSSLYTNLYQQKEKQDSLKLLLTQLLTRMDEINQLLVKKIHYFNGKIKFGQELTRTTSTEKVSTVASSGNEKSNRKTSD